MLLTQVSPPQGVMTCTENTHRSENLLPWHRKRYNTYGDFSGSVSSRGSNGKGRQEEGLHSFVYNERNGRKGTVRRRTVAIRVESAEDTRYFIGCNKCDRAGSERVEQNECKITFCNFKKILPLLLLIAAVQGIHVVKVVLVQPDLFGSYHDPALIF